MYSLKMSLLTIRNEGYTAKGRPIWPSSFNLRDSTTDFSYASRSTSFLSIRSLKSSHDPLNWFRPLPPTGPTISGAFPAESCVARVSLAFSLSTISSLILIFS